MKRKATRQPFGPAFGRSEGLNCSHMLRKDEKLETQGDRNVL